MSRQRDHRPPSCVCCARPQSTGGCVSQREQGTARLWPQVQWIKLNPHNQPEAVDFGSKCTSRRKARSKSELPPHPHTTHSRSSSVQSLSRVWLSAIPWTAAGQASLSITNSRSLLKLMSIKSVMPSNHFILCHPLLLPSVFPSIGGLFKWVSSSHQTAKVLEFQLQHQSFQWIFRTDIFCWTSDWGLLYVG